jgi:outer membrane protein
MASPSVGLGTLTALVWTLAAIAPAGAETLHEALSSAYKFNPRLDAARATQRATDEEVPRAISGYRPSITGSADTSYRHITTNPGTIANGDSNPRGYQVGLVQPLFRGFRTVSAVSSAEATVRAGRETLRLAEQSVLLEAVTAFGDVVRDAAIVRLR